MFIRITRERYEEYLKEERKEYLRNYSIENREHLNKYQNVYREKNHDKYLQIDKIGREKHKQKIKERQKSLVICSCGLEVKYGNKYRHTFTKVHNNHLNGINHVFQTI
jgi:hypothetical protein